MIKQPSVVAPPQPSDAMLRDFAQNIDYNLQALFRAGHVHSIVTSLPTSGQGNVGDIYLVNIAGAKKIAVKFSDGWYAVGVTKL